VTASPDDRKTQALKQAIHHLVVENELLNHQNDGLQRALGIKQKRKKPGKPVEFEEATYSSLLSSLRELGIESAREGRPLRWSLSVLRGTL
jgi:regulator of replication initiation timing